MTVKLLEPKLRIHKPKQLPTGAVVDPVARWARKLDQICQACGGMRECIFRAKAVGCPRTKAGPHFANAGRIQEIDVVIRVVDRPGQISTGILTRVPHDADSQLTEIAITLRKNYIAPEALDQPRRGRKPSPCYYLMRGMSSAWTLPAVS